MAAKGYDPNRTRVSDDTHANWLRSPLKGDITEVPGLGIATATKMATCEDKITTTYQLLGKYLSFKGKDVGTIEHADRFYYWLELIGTPTGHRSSVVRSIAEKLQLQFPDIYDADAYEYDDNNEGVNKEEVTTSSTEEWNKMQQPKSWWG